MTLMNFPKILRIQNTALLTLFIANLLQLWGGSWDITSHLLQEPETFFTPSHAVLYSGVGVGVMASMLSLMFYFKNSLKTSKSFGLSLKLVLLGTCLQLIAGPGDFIWHEAFGVDGFLSPTHLALLLGILVHSIALLIGFAKLNIIEKLDNKFITLMLGLSSGLFLFASMWFVFIFSLPISTGELFDFNPDPIFGLSLSIILLPILLGITLFCLNHFQKTYLSILTIASFLGMNITTNIIPANLLHQYIPIYLAPVIMLLISEKITHSISKSSFMELLKPALIASMFFITSFPMISMAFLIFDESEIFVYDLIPVSYDQILKFWMLTILPGFIFGLFGGYLAKRFITKRIMVQKSH